MANLPLKQTLDRIPGGMMLVPLLIGCIVSTFAPDVPKRLGSFSGALFTGAIPILAVFYVCMGATVEFRTTPYVLRKGGVLLATKIGCGLLAAFILRGWIGIAPVSSGWFAGLSTLAVVAAINDTNGGLYMALMSQYGRPRDAAAYSIMSIESGPFLTMLTLGIAGFSSFDRLALLGAILPLLVGMILGNLDAKMRQFLGAAVPVLIPFFAFALGTTIDLHNLGRSGLLGIGLGLFVVAFTGIALFTMDHINGGNGVAGLAAASTAGNAAAVPALVAGVNSAYAPAAASATVLVSASVMVSALVVPLITAWWAGRVKAQVSD
ncbi:MAG TPA: 2-keto-3-deoxygluconate permease [Humisphaera sp.]|nr:2-keto-3-deoxygluconate permease [Humisphaera sp.]